MQIQIDKQAVQSSFSKAATYYDKFADLQREIGFELMSLLPKQSKQANSILDLGCGTGYFSYQLNLFCNDANLTCLDLSPAMLLQAKRRAITNAQFLQADIDQLPAMDREFDLIFSNLVLQWSSRLDLCLLNLKQLFNEQTTLAFSTLLEGSLFELKNAWKSIDDEQHVNQFLTLSEVEKGIKKAGFTKVRLVTETRVKKFSNVIAIMKALKGIGANHVHRDSNNTSTNKQLLSRLTQAYQPYLDEDGQYNLTYQVCYAVIES